MGKVYNDPATGDVFVENTSGGRVWNTNYPPVNLLPQSAWITLNNYQIAFPDFEKRFAYGYYRWRNDFIETDYDSCTTLTTLAPREWGPVGQTGQSYDINLPQVVLGTVPSGCNYIDVRVSLTRTKAPNNFIGIAVPTLISGAETSAQGGSLELEKCGGWRRLLEVVLVGNQVVLRRYQSTRNVPLDQQPPWTTNYLSNAWSHGGGDGAANAAPAAIIQEKAGGNATNQRRRGGSDQCSMNTAAHDFSSTYTGTITIRPGRIPS